MPKELQSRELQLTNLQSMEEFGLISKLVPIKNHLIGNIKQNSVNARDLHKSLKSKQDFSDWIKDRLDQYYEEDFDYVVMDKSVKRTSGVKHLKEYILALGTARELSMLERNDMGHLIRRYFATCEAELLKFTGFKIDYVLINKHFKQANQTAKLLGLSQVEAIGHARDAIKEETGVDLYVFDPEAKHKAWLKDNSFTMAQLASKTNSSVARVRQALFNTGVLTKSYKFGRQARTVPTKIGAQYLIGPIDTGNNKLIFNKLGLDMLNVITANSIGHLDWDVKNGCKKEA